MTKNRAITGNPDFKPVEFDTFRKQAGLNSYKLSVKDWVEKNNAIGLKATAEELTKIE